MNNQMIKDLTLQTFFLAAIILNFVATLLVTNIWIAMFLFTNGCITAIILVNIIILDTKQNY